MRYQSIFFGSKQCISLKNLSTLRLFLNQISIATTSTIQHLMSRPKTALVHLNIPFLETLSILILRINHHACWHLSLHSCRVCPGVVFKCFPPTVKRILFTNWYRCQIGKVLHPPAPKEVHEWSCPWSQTLFNYAQFTVTHTGLYESSMLT